MNRSALIIALGAFSTPGRSFAEDARKTYQTAVSIEGGSLGVGASLWHTVNDSFSVNGGYNWFDFTYDVETSDVDFRGKLKLSNLPVMLNWHPMKGAFRLVGGVIFADNKIDVTARPEANATYDINGTTYTAAQVGSLTGTGELAKGVTPYAGLGWLTRRDKKGFGFFADLGVMFSGSPKVSLSASGPIRNDARFQTNLAREQENVNDEIKVAKVYPVIRFGLTYRM